MHAANLWKIHGFSEQGASHIRQNKPNQDAISWKELVSQPVVVMAVSDGHGSERCFRSQIGSKLAVQTAVNEMDAIFGQSQTLMSSSNAQQLSDIWERRIVEAWRQSVSEHYSKHPFDPENDPVHLLKNPDEPFLAYGATLLVVVVTPTYALYMQLGDGDILVVDTHFQVRLPIEPDPTLIANETTSLCQDNAWKFWRSNVQTFQEGFEPRLIMLSTDGYANSYPSAVAFNQVALDIAEQIAENGFGKVIEALPDWLKDTTLQGSGDDISVGLITRSSWATSNKQTVIETETTIQSIV